MALELCNCGKPSYFYFLFLFFIIIKKIENLKIKKKIILKIIKERLFNKIILVFMLQIKKIKKNKKLFNLRIKGFNELFLLWSELVPFIPINKTHNIKMRKS